MGDTLVVLGTRPEAIKLLPVIEALQRRGIPTRTCVTGQHRELLQGALGPTSMVPDIDLALSARGRSLAELTGTMICALAAAIAQCRPTRVVVQGDTATAAAAAHAAFLSQVPIAHVEAGLRTGDLESPYPEEGNRKMIAALADLHFAPTRAAADALALEGVPASAIHVTGNTVVDALHSVQRRLATNPEIAGDIQILIKANRHRHIILVTCHRRENHDAIDKIIASLRVLAARSDVLIAFPMHLNPAVRSPVFAALADAPNVELLQPLNFPAFVALTSAAHLILTDSGGVQEEAPVLGVPVLVLRDTTERPESVEAGTALLVGTETRKIVAEANRLLDSPLAHARMARRHSPYGDGRAAERIAEILCSASAGVAHRHHARR